MVAMGFMAALTAAMAAVIWLDITKYLIPNALNAAILALWVVALFFLPISPLMAFAAAAIVLFVGLGFFAIGLMGGGDIKLLVVLTLWLGWGMQTFHFIVLTALVGGVLVAVLLFARFIAAGLAKGRTLPRFLSPKQPVPYGLAIAGAFLLMLWGGLVPVFPGH